MKILALLNDVRCASERGLVSYNVGCDELIKILQDLIAAESKLADHKDSIAAKDELIIEIKEKRAESVQVSEPVAQSITEQGLREILNSFNKWFSRSDLGIHGCIRNFEKDVIDLYLCHEGRTLLAKLNEHREPELSVEPVGYMDSAGDIVEQIIIKQVCGNENNSRYQIPVYAHYPQFTANKAEVPDIQEMVNRFLGWKLPENFHPDCGISFKHNTAWGVYPNNWPIGTNLLTADQAKEMFEYALSKPLPPLKDGE